MNLILSQASVVACAFLYHSHYEEGISDANLNLTIPFNETQTKSTKTADTATKFTEEQLIVSTGGLFAIFLVSFVAFILKIERKYVKTFFSVETGHALAQRYFLQGTDDFTKSQTIGCNKYQWASIRTEVAEWLDENWDRWEREKPEWFNAVFVDSVDDDIMPTRVLARLKNEAENGERRRSSVLKRISERLEDGPQGSEQP